MLCASVSKNYCITTFKLIHAKFNLILLSLYVWKPIKSHLEILCNARNCFKAVQKWDISNFVFFEVSQTIQKKGVPVLQIFWKGYFILFVYMTTAIHVWIWKDISMQILTTVLRTHVHECSWNLIPNKYYDGRKIIHTSVWYMSTVKYHKVF